MIADFTIARFLSVCTLAAALAASGCASGKRAAESMSGSGQTAVPVVSSGPAQFSLQRRGPGAYLNARLANQSEIDLLLGRLTSIFGDGLNVERLAVNEGPKPTLWLDRAMKTVQNLAVIDELSVVVEDEVMRVGGWVESRDIAAELIGDTHAILAGDLGVEDGLDYPERVVSATELRQRTDTAAMAAKETMEPEAVLTLVAAEVPAAGSIPGSSGSMVQTPDATRSAINSQITTLPGAPSEDFRLQPAALTPEQPNLQPDLQMRVAERPVVPLQNSEAMEPLLQDSAPTVASAVPAVGQQPELRQEINPEPALAAALPMPSEQEILRDRDGDRVPDKYDGCSATASGSPVDSEGCPYLNGYLKNVRFYGQTDKLTRRAMITLDHLAGIIRQDPQTKVAVMSYTSNSGSPWEMRDKARMRARSVVGYLVQMGVDLQQLQAYAFGHVNGSGDQIVIREMN